MIRKALPQLVFVLLLHVALAAQFSPSQILATATLNVKGVEGNEVVFTLEQLKQMPQQSVSVINPHTKAKENYEGVLLRDLLAKVNAPAGDNLRGADMADYVDVMGSDRYRAVFALAELDPAFQDNNVLLAISSDGKPLSASVGPFRIIAPQDKRPARSVRMVVTITVRRAP